MQSMYESKVYQQTNSKFKINNISFRKPITAKALYALLTISLLATSFYVGVAYDLTYQ